VAATCVRQAGLEPQASGGPRQACYSHLWGSPWTGILLSGSDAPGEGEFKIMDWLLEQSEVSPNPNPNPDPNPNPNPNQAGGRAAPRSAVLVGGDGDLVLQALSMQARS
jgi:hypothetical protein